MLMVVVLGVMFGSGRAQATCWCDTPFNVQDEKDQGCIKTVLNIKDPCGACDEDKKGKGKKDKDPCGIPIFWVSQPYLNLWVADEPASYTTSLGEEITFRISYKQRDYHSFQLGSYVPQAKGWYHDWFSYVHVRGTDPDFPSWTAIVVNRGGGESYFDSGLGGTDGATGAQLLPMDGSHVYYRTNDSTSRNIYGKVGLRLVYADGSQDLYGQVTPMYSETYTNRYLGQTQFGVNYSPVFDALLTERIDPYGNSIHFYYTNSGLLNLLAYVVDYDGRTNTLTYSNNLLTRVDMPYGRSVSLTYNQGYVVSITDAEGMYSSFTYDGVPYYLTRMITPYGTNDFEHTDLGFMQGTNWVGNAGGTNRTSRAIKITHADGSHELYAYRYDSSLVGIAEQIGQLPAGVPWETLDSGISNTNSSANELRYHFLRNSFHWDRKQYSALSTNAVAYLKAADFGIAELLHWLAE